ncbi:formyltransferase family protein [Lentilitoribacter sp. EG35]|uniref:formyltransferase family protein n=1 Tax=Lentilitoribacter sp. EG35 TaxID=3234192 RepID=UPI00345F313B
MKFGFLSTIDSPILPYFLHFAKLYSIEDIIVIIDSKITSEKNKLIWQQRTGGSLFKGENIERSIYGKTSIDIPFMLVKSHNGDECTNLISKYKVDCLVNAGTPRKLDSGILDSVQGGVVNIHPGILPKYRGCSAVEWSIYNDDQVGNTAHFMSLDYDHGPVIDTEVYSFPRTATYQDIRRNVFENGCKMLGRVLANIENRTMNPLLASIQDETFAQFWEPIPQNIMNAMLEKISLGKYKYQLNQPSINLDDTKN